MYQIPRDNRIITKAEFNRLPGMLACKRCGHTFRIAQDCPEGYHLFIDGEADPKIHMSYEFVNGHKVYYRWQ